MKKLLAAVILSSILIVALLAGAFYYVHRTGHVALVYEHYSGGRLSGRVFVDRYLTEDKLIYKAVSEYTGKSGYPAVSQKLTLKRNTLSVVKYTEDATGVRGAKRTFSLTQKGAMTDLVYIEPPEYFVMDGFETGETTLVYSPLDVMLTMPIADKYNFWKRGSQYFEVMVPLDAPVPVMRDKLEVRYEKDEYVPVMGERIDADVLLMKSEGLPAVRVKLAKYSHRVLSLEAENGRDSFLLVSFPGGLVEEVQLFTERLRRIWPAVLKIGRVVPEEAPSAGEALRPSGGGGSVAADTASIKKEVFFKSSDQMLAGEVSLPPGKGPFRGIVLVPEDGPMKMGTKRLFSSASSAFTKEGYAVFVFDFPGQGKSQGDFQALDDEDRIAIVADAARAAGALPEVEDEGITVIGIREGGYLALKASSRLAQVSSCVAVDMPLSGGAGRAEEEMLNSVLKSRSFGPFDDNYMKTVGGLLKEHLESVKASLGDRPFFMGMSLPSEAYRDCLGRDPQGTIGEIDRPVLLIIAKNSMNYRPLLMEGLKKEEDKGFLKVAVFRDLGEYLDKADSEGGHVLDEDVLVVVKKWIDGTAVKETGQEEAEMVPEALQGEN